MPSPSSEVQKTKPRADKSLTEEDCEKPVMIPDRELGWKETSQLWGQDRTALVDCFYRNQANRKGVNVVTRADATR